MLPGTYFVAITWDAPAAAIAGEVELTVETLEATGEYADFIVESRSEIEPSQEAATSTTAEPAPDTTTQVDTEDDVETTTSTSLVSESTDHSSTATTLAAPSEDGDEPVPLLPIVLGVVALLIVATGGAFWMRRRR